MERRSHAGYNYPLYRAKTTFCVNFSDVTFSPKTEATMTTIKANRLGMH